MTCLSAVHRCFPARFTDRIAFVMAGDGRCVGGQQHLEGILGGDVLFEDLLQLFHLLIHVLQDALQICLLLLTSLCRTHPIHSPSFVIFYTMTCLIVKSATSRAVRPEILGLANRFWDLTCCQTNTVLCKRVCTPGWKFARWPGNQADQRYS